MTSQFRPQPPSPDDTSLFNRRIPEIRSALAQLDPIRKATETGTEYFAGQMEFHFPIWDRQASLGLSDLVVRYLPDREEAPLMIQAMALYHFKTADGAPLAGRWISFSELPNGRFYNQAYQGYSGGELARFFGDDVERFAYAAQTVGGATLPEPSLAPGDLAFMFDAFPRFPLLAIAWRGDEDFPASYQILFDQSAPHYMITDGCAILGGMLARRITAAGKP